MTEHDRHTDDERLSAYLDGELPRDEADRLTERLAAEPALARRLEALRSADANARSAFAAIDDEPLPRGVLELLQDDERGARTRPRPAPADNVVPFPVRVLRSFASAPVAAAASLALVAGFLARGQLEPAGDPPAGLQAVAVPADSGLHELLESGIGPEPRRLGRGSTGRVLLTFEDTVGDYCRQVQLADDAGSMQAVACRRDGAWRMEVASFGAPPGPAAGPYATAASDSPPAVGATVDDLIGDRAPLGARAEQRLVESGWNRNGD